MKVSYNWLKDFVEVDISPSELAERLTMAGIEVEDVVDLSPGFKGVVVGKVLSIERHPNADRLSLCRVEAGKDVYDIVCGAKNMKAGDRVALALPGAILPGDVKIGRAVIRGVESQGMMCSPRELGLGEDGANLLILPSGLETGVDLGEALGLMDTILELSITPNRGDCLSILGIAREIAAITGARFKDPFYLEEGEGEIEGLIEVEIRDRDLCPRYAAKIVEGVSIGPSPLWLRQRLEAIGIRPINNVVDVTNYVMMERGQPLHAFDYECIRGKTIIVRRAEEGEKILTLDGVERTLSSENLVIADRKGPIAIAGVMGGKDSEVTESTKTILLESAHFDPGCVRRSSKRLGLTTESSYRFERGVDPGENLVKAIERAAYLIRAVAGGRTTRTLDRDYLPKERPEIRWRPERVRSVTGVDMGTEEMVEVLKRLSIRCVPEGEGFVAYPPSYRMDLKEEMDIVEEIIRIRGYDSIPESLPRVRLDLTSLKRDQILERRVRDALKDFGFSEVMNYSFVSPRLLETFGYVDGLLSIVNPLTEEQSVMRPSLIPGLVENARYNQNHQNLDLRLFEIGKVFSGLEERRKMAGLITGSRWKGLWAMEKGSVDIFDMKGVLEGIFELLRIGEVDFAPIKDVPYLSPSRGYILSVCGKDIGLLGEIHPIILHRLEVKGPVFVFEINLEDLFHIPETPRLFRPIPRYPYVTRDLSFLVDESISFGSIKERIMGMDPTIRDVSIFDLYKGKGIPEGKKSLGIRITYLSEERTLTEEEVNSIHTRVIKELEEGFHISLRGP